MSGSAAYMIISAIITIVVLSVIIRFVWRYRLLYAVCHILLNIVACIAGIVFLAKQAISVGLAHALTQAALTVKGIPWCGAFILADIFFLALSILIVCKNEEKRPRDWERFNPSPPPSDEDMIRIHSGDIYSDNFMNIYRVVSINENNVRLNHLGNLENRRNYHDAAGNTHIYGGTGTVFADKKGKTSELLNGKEYFYDKLFLNGTEIIRVQNSYSPNYKYNSFIKEQ